MARFHINAKTGEPGQCKLAKDQCSFGGAEKHYPTAEIARRAFEGSKEASSNKFFNWAKSIKVYSPTPESARAAEKVRWAADRYWENPAAHRRHLFRFAQKLQGRCIYCGTTKGIYLNEHLIPATKGGITVVGNIGPSCATCNFSKNDMAALEFFSKRLEELKFSHPVFGRSPRAFEIFLNSYQKPFQTRFPDEWELAQRILSGDADARDELVRGATRKYNQWRKEVFPPSDGIWYTETEEEDFAVHHARGEFRSIIPSAEIRYSSVETPFWVAIKTAALNMNSRDRQALYSDAETVFDTAKEMGVRLALQYWAQETVDQATGRVKTGGSNGRRRRAAKILEITGV